MCMEPWQCHARYLIPNSFSHYTCITETVNTIMHVAFWYSKVIFDKGTFQIQVIFDKVTAVLNSGI